MSNRKNYVGAPLESQNLTRGQGGWSKPHAMEKIGQDGSSEALAELDQWLSTTGFHQARAPLLISSVSVSDHRCG